MAEITKRERHTPHEQEPHEQLCNGETAERIVITRLKPGGVFNERFLLTLDYGWAQSNIAICDYDHDAAGVAAAVALALECDVEWLPDAA